MTTKEQLIHEIEQFPESFLKELLEFLVFFNHEEIVITDIQKYPLFGVWIIILWNVM